MSIDQPGLDPPAGSGASLAERLRRGSREAMAEAYSQHIDAIYNFCFRRSGSWATAEDLCSDVFLTAWRRHRAVLANDAGSVLPWLYGIATNVCRNHLRSTRRGTAALAKIPAIERPQLDDQVLAQLAVTSRVRDALRQVAELAPGDQEVFVLVCWEELSYSDAAAALGIRIGTVRSRLARVRRTLRTAERPLPAPASLHSTD
ncbi:RNA polymerase sigma factor [Microlunatus sp. GCM10028923]|uniref:RNA polymerase sigma factor n=1 Tax=Microlunatus sp. GCM10028923 TaxID=3273400 RepID=UPI00361FDE7C